VDRADGSAATIRKASRLASRNVSSRANVNDFLPGCDIDEGQATGCPPKRASQPWASLLQAARSGRRILHLVRRDLTALRPRLRLLHTLIRLLPYGIFGWARPAIYRLAGVRIGSRVRVLGAIAFTGEGDIAANVLIGDDCFLTTPLFLNASARITIGRHVTIGHHVVVITDNHEYHDPQHRCGQTVPACVTIEDGVWVAACVTILPGVTVGRGSVVSAGSVVLRNVPPHTMVAGVPAQVVKHL
jgi:maltose O-acetyltransferase